MKISTSFWYLLLPGCLWVNSAVAETALKTEQLVLGFGEQGQLLSVQACFPDCESGSTRAMKLDDDSGLVSFSSQAEGQWRLEKKQEPKVHILNFQGPDGAWLRWTIPETGYGIRLETHGMGELRLQPGKNFVARDAPGFGEWLEQVRYLAISPGNVRQVFLDDTDAGVLTAEWVGFRSRFWAVLLSVDVPLSYFAQTGEGNVAPELTSQAAVNSMNWHFYLGPVERQALSAVDESLPQLMYAGLWFWLRWICIFLSFLLGWIQLLLIAWGPSIMLLSVCVGVLMLPLSRLADRVQQQVHRTEARLASELARIKREFKGEEQAAKILAYYKSEQVHPLYSLKSLLGVAIVIPIFIGAFDMLAENIYLMNTPFLWIDDLSRPDHWFSMPFELPFFGAGFNLLPFLMTGLSIVASLLHQPLALQADLRRRQVGNMILLAVAFFVLFYTFPAGMVLYWTTNNLISVVKNLWSSLSTRQAEAGL